MNLLGNLMSKKTAAENEYQDQYQYQPLPRDGKQFIRIASICPSKSLDDPIEVFLRIEGIDYQHNAVGKQKPNYEALSYAWGPKEDSPAKIYLQHVQDGRTYRGYLPARENLIAALRQLRSKTVHRDMWIDAICIDQGSSPQAKAEKAFQVDFMGAIFQHADRVIVWLGPEADKSDHVMLLLNELGSSNPGINILDLANTLAWANIRQGVPLYFNVTRKIKKRDFDAIYKFVCRSWFDRLWVRQEVFLANQHAVVVQCGQTQIPWETLLAGWQLMYMRFWSEASYMLYERGVHLIGFFVQILSRNPITRQPSFWATLDQHRIFFSTALCEDPRDRIFAIKTTLHEELQAKLEVNYNKTKVEVYTEAVRAHLRVEKNLNILSQCELTPLWTGPSWVPDWETPLKATIPIPGVTGTNIFRTGWELAGPDVLSVSGVGVGKIIRVKPLLPSQHTDFPHETIKQLVRQLFSEEERSFDAPYPGGGTILDAYTQTFFTGAFEGTADGAFMSFESAKRQLYHWKENKKHSTAENNGGKLDHIDLHKTLKQTQSSFEATLSAMMQYSFGKGRRDILHSTLASTLSGRALIYTEDGFIGLGPKFACPGDIACILFGTTKLLLLRPAREGQENRFHVVGECFLHGAMQGEPILGPLPPGLYQVKRGTKCVFKNAGTSVEVDEDPRLGDLGLDLDNYRKDLPHDGHVWLDVELDLLRGLLGARGVEVLRYDLV